MDITLLDICDIAIAALLLFYTYRIMKESGALNLFFGVLAFVGVWIIASQVLDMKLIGTVLNKFMSIGLLILVILFPDQIKRFLVQLGDHKRWGFIRRIFRMKAKSDNSEEERHRNVIPIVYACMNMSRTRTGACPLKPTKTPATSSTPKSTPGSSKTSSSKTHPSTTAPSS